jgi:hypothetical protein
LGPGPHCAAGCTLKTWADIAPLNIRSTCTEACCAAAPEVAGWRALGVWTLTEGDGPLAGVDDPESLLAVAARDEDELGVPLGAQAAAAPIAANPRSSARSFTGAPPPCWSRSRTRLQRCPC